MRSHHHPCLLPFRPPDRHDRRRGSDLCVLGRPRPPSIHPSLPAGPDRTHHEIRFALVRSRLIRPLILQDTTAYRIPRLLVGSAPGPDGGGRQAGRRHVVFRRPIRYRDRCTVRDAVQGRRGMLAGRPFVKPRRVPVGMLQPTHPLDHWRVLTAGRCNLSMSRIHPCDDRAAARARLVIRSLPVGRRAVVRYILYFATTARPAPSFFFQSLFFASPWHGSPAPRRLLASSCSLHSSCGRRRRTRRLKICKTGLAHQTSRS